jgi:hypothetical protein
MANAQGLVKQTCFAFQSALGTPATSGGQIMRRTSSVFTQDKDTYSNNEIVSHQMSTGATHGIRKTSGKLDGLISPLTYSLPFAALIRKDFAATSAITSLSLTIASSGGGIYTITRGSGDFLTGGIKVGDVIRLSAGSFAAGNLLKNILVISLTATVLTVKPLNGVAMVAEGPITGSTVTVIGKKAWTPTTGHTNKYLTVEERYTDVTKFEQFTDCKIAAADITLPATGPATVSFDVPGLARTRSTAETVVSPSAETTTNVLTAVNGLVVVNGAATTITNAQLQITGNIAPGEAEVGSNSISDMIRGEVAVSGSFSAKFSGTTLQDLYDNETTVSLILVITDGTSGVAEFVTFVMPAIKLFGDTPDDGEAKEIVRSYPFTAEYYGSGGASLASHATIISHQDSLAA